MAEKVNVITRIACYRCVLTLSVNFLNTLMGIMKGHVVNQARASILPCKGMCNETCTVQSRAQKCKPYNDSQWMTAGSKLPMREPRRW